MVAIGIGIIFTLVFSVLPLVAAVLFFVYYKHKFPRSSLLPPLVAVVVVLAQLYLSIPFIADATTNSISKITPIKTVDYQVYSLISGVLIFFGILAAWFYCRKTNIDQHRKIALYLLAAGIVMIAFQITGAYKYTVDNREDRQKAYQEQLTLAEQFGSPVFGLTATASGELKLNYGEFSSEDAYLGGNDWRRVVIYSQIYSDDSQKDALKITQINTATTGLTTYPCTIDFHNTPQVGVDCRLLGETDNGFSIYGRYIIYDVGRYKSDTPQLANIYLQNENTRILIPLIYKYTVSEAIDTAKMFQQIEKYQAIKNDFVYKNQ